MPINMGSPPSKSSRQVVRPSNLQTLHGLPDKALPPTHTCSYSLAMIPSQLLGLRIGVARWLGILVSVWGLVAASFSTISSVTQFYVLRFLLGVAEAGAFPGEYQLLYLVSHAHGPFTFACSSTAAVISQHAPSYSVSLRLYLFACVYSHLVLPVPHVAKGGPDAALQRFGGSSLHRQRPVSPTCGRPAAARVHWGLQGLAVAVCVRGHSHAPDRPHHRMCECRLATNSKACGPGTATLFRAVLRGYRCIAKQALQ